MDFKFLIAADVHLDSPLHGLSQYPGAPLETLRGATREALKNLVRLALDEQVAFVLLAGDLYDGNWRDYNTGLFLGQQLARLQEGGIRAFIIHGNHDAENRMTHSLRLPDNVTVFRTNRAETVHLETLGVALHGQGFARKDVTDNLAEHYPTAQPDYFNIGLLHTALAGYQGHAPYAPCALGTLQAKGYNVWALGHVHTATMLCEQPLILFPGNIQGRHVRETGAKGCTLVTVEDGRVVSHQHRDLQVLRWEVLPVDASDADTPDSVVDLTAAAVAAAVERCGGEFLATRLCIGGDCRAHRRLLENPTHWATEIRAAVTGATAEAAWVEKVQFLTRPGSDPEVLMPGSGPLADLLRYVDELSADDRLRELLADDLKMLREKLPAEVFMGDQGLAPDTPEALARTVADLKGLLIPRLLAAQGAA
jgi:DNA repair exonuclease SbcCD nuclease subunit